MRYYYEDVLGRQNHVAQPNLVWAADFTSFKLNEEKKVHCFFCIDIYSNRIVADIFRTRTITTSDIIRKLDSAIKKRIPIKPKRKLILHTDRGTQFSNLKYNKFLEKNNEFLIGSMSRANSPKDNAVIERFIRTFKEHKIKGKTFQNQLLYEMEQNPNFRGYRRIFNLYRKNLDLKPNKKTGFKTPYTYDVGASVAAKLMIEPRYPKAFSEHFGQDFRRNYINKFKEQSDEVVNALDDIAAKRSEVVQKTPFDSFEDNLGLKLIDEKLQSIYDLISSNPEITSQYVTEAILPIHDMLESMDDKLNRLLPKPKKPKFNLPLRDPIDTKLFKVFLGAAASNMKYKKDLRCAQLKIAYTILFYTGLRVNEIRCFKEHHIRDAIKTSQFNVVHFKQNESYIHVISEAAVKELKELKNCYDIIFLKYKFRYLFGKDKPLDNKYFIKMINKDLKNTYQINEIPYNVKSHSFRINMITNLLKNTSVQDAAEIIGHKDIKSTLAYKRYALNKREIQNLLNKIDKSNSF